MKDEQVNTQIDRARELIGSLLRLMEIEGSINRAEMESDQLMIHVESPDAGRLIGKGAQALDSFQYLVNRLMIAADEAAPRCVIDVGRYRERHRDKLLDRAFKAADEVERTGEGYRFEPMSSYDRRIIHQALESRTDVTTTSESSAQHRWKQLVVQPVESERLPAEEPEEEDDTRETEPGNN